MRKTPDGYELVAGERRLRACKLAGMERVPALLWEGPDPKSAALGLLENLQRADLNPFEQAAGLRDVLALWGVAQPKPPAGWAWRSPTLAISCGCCS